MSDAFGGYDYSDVPEELLEEEREQEVVDSRRYRIVNSRVWKDITAEFEGLIAKEQQDFFAGRRDPLECRGRIAVLYDFLGNVQEGGRRYIERAEEKAEEEEDGLE